MKKVILILVVTIGLIACGTKEVKVEIVNEVVKVVEAPKSDFSNPGFMAGSSFGEFFISMLRTQNYEMALKFTSKESINKFGTDKILDKYKTFKYNYSLTQKSITKSGDKYTIKYTTNEMATGKLKSMTIVVENDSCKLILPDNLEDLLK